MKLIMLVILMAFAFATQAATVFKDGFETPLMPLNDTGITTCADDFNDQLTCPLQSYPIQDGDVGRDIDQNDNSDGHAGFSFTKLDAGGNDLDTSAPAWSCVRDNVSGLIWEQKTNTPGLHNTNDNYNWYSSDTSNDGGHAGFLDDDGAICFGYNVADSSTWCNTEAFAARVNLENLCGLDSWRLPSKIELLNIVSLDRSNPAIDTDYFQFIGFFYWSSTPNPSYPENAWLVSLGSGSASSANAQQSRPSILVSRRP